MYKSAGFVYTQKMPLGAEADLNVTGHMPPARIIFSIRQSKVTDRVVTWPPGKAQM
jgi:hypothetical protein